MPRLTAQSVLERHFLELRCEILNLAAALDRIERSEGATVSSSDVRWKQLQDGLAILATSGADRAERVQMLFSDKYEVSWNK